MIRAVILALFLLTNISRLPVAEDRADVTELNHYYDEQGKLVFDQLVFWDGNGEYDRCFAWRFTKDRHVKRWRDYQRGGYVTIMQDGNELRIIRSISSPTSWTQFDPEVHDRQYLPQSKRRGLIRPKSND